MTGLRRVLGALLVVFAAHATATIASAALRTEPRAPGPLLPAAGGPLTDLAIQFHAPGAEVFLPVFGALLGALAPTTTVHVVVADDADRARFEVARAGWFAEGGGPVVTYTATGEPITSWMRDRLAVLGAPGRPPWLLAPAAPMAGPDARVRDWRVPWTLGAHLGPDVRVRRTAYRFDGGDLIADDERAYVVTTLLERNPDLDPRDLLAQLSRDIGLPVLHLGAGGVSVPDHHIGMFVTPLGGGRVAVGDPDLALALLGDAGVDPASLVVGGAPLAIDTSEATRARFAHVAEGLRAAGLTVVPLPLLPSRTPWVWITYDNVLMERRADGLHVYLPTYGVAALDEAAAAIWRGEGAVVHPIPVEGLFRLGGSVRCLVAPVRRGEVADAAPEPARQRPSPEWLRLPGR